MTYLYGLERHRGCAAWLRREFIHAHIVGQRSVAHALPTNVRAVYYVGKGTAWPPDKAGPGRKSAQDVSDACQWLIDHGLVGEDEVVDADGHMEASIGVSDVLAEVLDYARHVAICPWSPNPVPTIICEGRNDLALVRPIGHDRLVRWIALGGMGGRGHLRHVAPHLPRHGPVGYVGDWNRAGFDIERNARALLEGKGWRGTWTRLLVTDEQASELSSKMVVDVDGRDGQAGQSIETAAMPVGDARDVIHRWLDGLAPAVPDADESKRGAVMAALEALGA